MTVGIRMGKIAKYRRLLTLLAGVVGILLANPTFAEAKEFDCWPTSQIKLGCHYLLKNTGLQAKELGSQIWAAIRGTKTPEACVIEQFERHPELWKNLEVSRGTRGPSRANQLAVHNVDEEMASVCSQEIGSCWGQASVKMHFSYGAIYDPTFRYAKRPDAVEGSRKWVNHYVRQMQKILDGEVQLIAGFRGLHEMSSHPQLIEEFKKLVVIAWAKRLAKLENVKLMLYEYSGVEASRQFVRDIEQRIALGQMPKLVFSYNAGGSVPARMRAKTFKMKEAHIVLGLEVHPLTGNRTLIKVWDDKKSVPHTNELLIIDHNTGLATFIPWAKDVKDAPPGTLPPTTAYFAIAKEQDSEYRKLALSMGALCKKHPELCEEMLQRAPPRSSRPVLPTEYGDLDYADK